MAKRTIIDQIEKPMMMLVLLVLVWIYLSKGKIAFYYTAIGLVVVLLVCCVLFIRIIIKRRRRFFSTQDTLHKLRSLTPDQFEDYIAELFRHLGYRTEKVGGSNDGGIDVIAEKNGVKHYIQCKKFIVRQVGVHDMRDFYGALTHRYTNAKAFFVTTNIFTLEAEKFCEDKSIELIDGNKLMDYVRQAGIAVPKVDVVERCPRCTGTLIARDGKFGPFFGCSNYPKCKYTKST